MGKLADQFSSIFRTEHRAVRDALFELSNAFQRRAPAESRTLLTTVAGLTGPHFRYEEEMMYPALVQIFGRGYIDKLFSEHSRLIASAERLVELTGKENWSDQEVEEGLELVRSMLPHVSDCDGLSIMVESLPEQTVQDILSTRERCNNAGLDLLTWAHSVRKQRRQQAN